MFDFLKFRSMHTDADKHLKDFNALTSINRKMRIFRGRTGTGY
ncbi:hypothetical protein NXV05_21100 [Parabacteroides johnsonii]|nr:hypothetical protein [Parabacteroides johnsonii]